MAMIKKETLLQKFARLKLANAAKNLEAAPVVPLPDTKVVTLQLGPAPSTNLALPTPKALEGELITKLEYSASTQVADTTRKEVTPDMLNVDQARAANLMEAGTSFVLVGSAGSGKTTTQQVGLTQMQMSGVLNKLTTGSKAFLEGSPSILVVSFTNVAVNNMKKNAPVFFRSQITTIHKAVEYRPVIKEYYNPETGETETSMRFEPLRTSEKKLPDFTHCVIEEAGSVATDLYRVLRETLPKNCAFIFLGDLNQLPPVMGLAVLGFAMLKFETVELTKVYRTDDDSPIKVLATDVLKGNPITAQQLEHIATKYNKPSGRLLLHPFVATKSKRMIMKVAKRGSELNNEMGEVLAKQVADGVFKGDGSCIALMAIGKDEGEKWLNTEEVNRHVAQALGIKRGAVVHEIKLGFNKKYYAIGDLVFHDKAYWKIKSIEVNPAYTALMGHDFAIPSPKLNRWGMNTSVLDEGGADSMDFSFNPEADCKTSVLEMLDLDTESAEKARKSMSHRLILSYWNPDDPDTEYEAQISEVGEGMEIKFGYAQTIHKSQGSEWDRVWMLLPEQHSYMLYREMLYTGITRTKVDLHLYYENGREEYNRGKGTFNVGVVRQRIAGNKLEDKVWHFYKAARDQSKYGDFITSMWPESQYTTTSQFDFTNRTK